jgi:phage tail sheath gpL-like
MDFGVIVDTRVPGVQSEVDNSAAATGSANPKSLLIGQRLSTGTEAADTAARISNANDAAAKFGFGSVVHRMAIGAFANDPLGEHWAIGMDDDGAAAQATGTVTITVTTAVAGTIYLYIGGTRITYGVSAGEAQNDIATGLGAKITADTTLPVTAGVATHVVTLTAKNGGLLGNKIDMQSNYLGAEGGESTPGGVTVALVQMSAGATDPDASGAIDAMLEDEYAFVYFSLPVATPLNLLQLEMDDSSTGRWGPERQLYGHVWYAYEAATVSNLSTFGNLRNDQHATCVGVVAVPTWEPEFAAAYGARCAESIKRDPAAPMSPPGLEVKGVLAPRRTSAMLSTERGILLTDGIATFTQNNNRVYLERSITTYQTDAGGGADASYLDVQTLKTLEKLLTDTKTRVPQTFPRFKLANNGFPIRPGQKVVTPDVLKGFFLSLYREWEAAALVENIADFAEALVVERSLTNVNAVDVLMPPDLINQFRNLRMRWQFRLQFPTL